LVKQVNMENKNITTNLIIKQINQSNAIAYNSDYLSESSDYNFKILEVAYANTAALYASIKMNIENNNCTTSNCYYENKKLKQLEEAPKLSIDFIQNVMSELSTTDTNNYDVNNDYRYLVANSMFNSRPGFSKTDGYELYLNLNEDGTQTMFFNGPMFKEPLIINSAALESILDSNTFLIAPTPNIEKEMLRLLTEVGLFAQSDILDNGTLSPNAMISEEFIAKNVDGSFDYIIIDIGNGKGRNTLKFDLDKIERKVDSFINAEVAGLLSSEQETVAAWNVYIAKGTSVEEDDQMTQSANAGSDSWSYKEDLPLSQDKKVLFESKYKEYFMNNYLKQFTTNQLPTVKEDAAVFDLEEARSAKAQKFIDDNNL
tara:strand:- start:3054 stop:4169 length:1116 start_codon:yes stop_codon:yes gene_type:complete